MSLLKPNYLIESYLMRAKVFEILEKNSTYSLLKIVLLQNAYFVFEYVCLFLSTLAKIDRFLLSLFKFLSKCINI